MAQITTQFNAIMATLDAAVDIALQDDVAETMKDLVKQSVEQNVFSAYVSDAKKPYRRRIKGGLDDPANYLTYTEGNHTLCLENQTKGNAQYSDSDGWDEGNITDIIESGKGYHWTGSKIYATEQARPFMDEAINYQGAQIELGNALRTGLAKQGFMTEVGDLDF